MCHQIYNLFYPSDPSALRIEPLLIDRYWRMTYSQHLMGDVIVDFVTLPPANCRATRIFRLETASPSTWVSKLPVVTSRQLLT